MIAVRGWLRILVKDEAGHWRQRALGLEDTPRNREHAARRLDEVRRAMQASAGLGGPPTVEAWGERWFRTRTNEDVENDRARIRLHVYPTIGGMRLAAERYSP